MHDVKSWQRREAFECVDECGSGGSTNDFGSEFSVLIDHASL